MANAKRAPPFRFSKPPFHVATPGRLRRLAGMDANTLLLFALGSALLTHGHDCCFDDDDEARAEAFEACEAAVPQPVIVCGEDGRSYASVCDAEYADVAVVSEGACPDDLEPPISFTAD